jgi:eukaryotic-like serine/threonine-protein kinase
MPISAGTRLGPYEIVSLLGAGGMGEVYQARDARLNRMVALKVLPAELVANEERKRRFIQEAQLASSLQHPNIITIFDIGSAEGGEYLAMELVRGKTLDSVIPQKGLRLPEALRIGVQITDALAAAHGAGIVHRDLKPGNIMVTEQGQIKILDFGLATLTEATPMSAADETRVQPTAVETGAGTILGTVAYMSPEKAEGKKVDARSDIFSFGAILYEMLSGKRAFRADSTPGTLAAVINLEPQPLSTVVEDVPQAVDRLVSRCLRKDLSRRAQHASDIKLALEELQEDSDAGSLGSRTAVAPVPKRRGRGALPLIGVAVLVLIAAAAAVILWPRTPPAPSAFAPVSLTSLPGFEGSPTLSPDGGQVAFSWQREGTVLSDIYAQLVGGGATPLRLTDDGITHGLPAWSPDGKSIALWHLPTNANAQGPAARPRLVLVSSLGGTERQVTEWTGGLRRIV